jgi:hypothetical protein
MGPPFGLAPGELVDDRFQLVAAMCDRHRLREVWRVDLGDVAKRGLDDRLLLRECGELLLQGRQGSERLARGLPAEPLFAPTRVSSRYCHVHRVHEATSLVKLNCAQSARSDLEDYALAFGVGDACFTRERKTSSSSSGRSKIAT